MIMNDKVQLERSYKKITGYFKILDHLCELRITTESLSGKQVLRWRFELGTY
jgi:hypothetical protein